MALVARTRESEFAKNLCEGVSLKYIFSYFYGLFIQELKVVA